MSNNELDGVLNIGVDISIEGVEAKLAKSLKALGTNSSVEKAVKDFGDNLLKNADLKPMHEKLTRLADQALKDLKKVKDAREAVQGGNAVPVDANKLMEGFKLATLKFSTEDKKLGEVERILKKRIGDIQRLVDSTVAISNSPTKSTFSLDKVVGMPDEKKIQANEKTLTAAYKQLETLKTYYSDLKKVHSLARGLNMPETELLVAGMLTPLKNQLRVATAGTDIPAARKRVEAEELKAAENLRKGLAAAEQLQRDWEVSKRKEQLKQIRSAEVEAYAEREARIKGSIAAETLLRDREVSIRQAAAKKEAAILEAEAKRAIALENYNLKHQAGIGVINSRGGFGNFDATNLNAADLRNATRAIAEVQSITERYRTTMRNLGQDVSHVDSELKKYSTDMEHASKQTATLNKFGEQMAITVRNFLRFAVAYQAMYAVLNFFKSLTGSVVELNRELANMQAITASTTQEMHGISDAILQTAANSKYSIADMTEAAKVIAQAGASAAELPAILKATSDFASGTDTQLATAADIITSVKEIYKGLSEADIANQLTKAVNISKLAGDDLKTVVSIGAQVAEGYNLTSDQLLAAAATLRNAGVKASTLSTGLRQALLEVFNPNDASVKILEKRYAELGQNLSAAAIKNKYFNFSKEADPLLAVINELKSIGFGAGGDFTLGRAFDVRALNVLKELVNSSGDYLKLQKEITFGQPAAQAAATSMESLNSQWVKFKNLLSGAVSDTASPLIQKLTDMMKYLNSLMEKYNHLRGEETSAGKPGVASYVGNALSNPYVLGGAGVTALGGALLLTPAAPAAPWVMSAGAAMMVGGAGGSAVETSQGKFNSSAVTADSRRSESASASADLLAARERYNSYDPVGEAGKVRKELDELTATVSKVFKTTEEAFGPGAANNQELQALLTELKTAVNPDRRREIIAQLQKLAVEPSKITNESITALVNDISKVSSGSDAILDNFKSLYRELNQNVEKGVEGSKEQLNALLSAKDPLDGSSAPLNLLSGKGSAEDRKRWMEASMLAYTATLSKGLDDQTKLFLAKRKDSFATDLEIAASKGTKEQNTAEVIGVIQAHLADLMLSADKLGMDVILKELKNSSDILQLMSSGTGALTGRNIDSKVIQSMFNITPRTGNGKGMFPNGFYDDNAAKLLAADNKRKADAKAEYDLAHTKHVLGMEEKKYIADPVRSAELDAINFQIESQKKLGASFDEMSGMMQKKNAIIAGIHNEEITIAKHNVEWAKTQDNETQRKAAADLSRAQLSLQKDELQSKEEYLSGIQSLSKKELDGFDVRVKSILDGGGDLSKIGDLNKEFIATQQKSIEQMKIYMRDELHWSESQIAKYFETNKELNRPLISDAEVDRSLKGMKAKETNLAKLMPKSATTGDTYLDAKARAGLGFTFAEASQFASGKIGSFQQQIAEKQSSLATLNNLKIGASDSKKEGLETDIAAREEEIKNFKANIEDLQVEIDNFHTSAGEQLASVFNADGIRKYTSALEASGNVLKDWGNNIRTNVLSAWDGVSNAISSSIIEGKNFGKEMRNVLKTLANDVLTTTTKNIMNNSLLALMGQGYGGNQAGEVKGIGSQPAAKKKGGFLSGVAEALGGALGGGKGAGASTTGVMNVTAGTVNVNGGEGLGGLPTVGGDTGEKSIVSTVTSKFSSIFGAIKNSLSSMLAGMGSTISTMASSAMKWIGTLFASTGAIIPYKFAGGYVSQAGIIHGPGSGTSDSIRGSMYTASGRAPIAVSSGESILTARATSFLGHDTIKSLNDGSAMAFAKGGLIAEKRMRMNQANLRTPSASVTVNPAEPPSFQIVNTIHSASVVQEGLDHPTTVKKLLNMVKANRSSFQQVLR